jgi:hypothetical protein
LSCAGGGAVPAGIHANILAGVPLAVPQPDRAGDAVPPTFRSPSAASGDEWWRKPDWHPGDAGGRLAGSWHESSAPPLTRVFTSPSPEPAPDTARSLVRSPFRPPTHGGSLPFPADVHLIVPRSRGRRSPETLAVHLLVLRRSSGRPRRRRGAVGGAGGPSDAWNRLRRWSSAPCLTATRKRGGSGSRSMTLMSSRSGPGSSAPMRCWSYGACPCRARTRTSPG